MQHDFRHFLVVEDDAVDAILIRHIFGSFSPRCTSSICRNTSEALAYLKGAGMYSDRSKYPIPDAIISDVRLPGESGLDLIRWIRSEAAFNGIPVMVLTGAASPSEMDAAQHVGAQKVLRKPLSSGELKVLLQSIVQGICNEIPGGIQVSSENPRGAGVFTP